MFGEKLSILYSFRFLFLQLFCNSVLLGEISIIQLLRLCTLLYCSFLSNKLIGNEPYVAIKENQSIHLHKMVFIIDIMWFHFALFFWFLVGINVQISKSYHWFLFQKSVSFKALSKISSALALLVKAVLQFIILVWFLCFRIPRPDIFLVQVSLVMIGFSNVLILIVKPIRRN